MVRVQERILELLKGTDWCQEEPSALCSNLLCDPGQVTFPLWAAAE